MREELTVQSIFSCNQIHMCVVDGRLDCDWPFIALDAFLVSDDLVWLNCCDLVLVVIGHDSSAPAMVPCAWPFVL
jgi:hypothetical protein